MLLRGYSDLALKEGHPVTAAEEWNRDPVDSHQVRSANVGGMQPREPELVLTQEEAVQFLLRSGAEYEISFCTRVNCEVCHAFVQTWESVYSSLSPRWQRLVDAKLATGEVLRPTLPAEGY